MDCVLTCAYEKRVPMCVYVCVPKRVPIGVLGYCVLICVLCIMC